jgi:hypothetical protein
MQVFRELSIRGEPEQLAATAEAVLSSMTGDWARDAETEERTRRGYLGGARHVYCFHCKKRGQRPAATLFLMDRDQKTYSVVNIVPDEVDRLSYAEYNSILEEFFRQFVQPATARTGARAEMTEAEADLERWLSPETVEKLRLFCLAANKRTGSSHPTDRERWYDFIVSAHREGAEFDSSTLARWLHEAGEWDEEWSDKLAIEYEFARGLLAHADMQSVGV